MNFEQKVELIRRAYGALAKDDLEYIHPEVELRDPTRPDSQNPSGVWRGHDGMRRSDAEWRESFEEFDFSLQEFVPVGEMVAVRARASGRARASEIVLENERFHLIGFRDGRISSIENCADLAAAQAAAERAASRPVD